MKFHKKSRLVFLFLCMVYSLAFSTSIEVSGNISSNSIWDTDTVLVIGDVILDSSVTLSINPGTFITFLDWEFSFTIHGNLLAIGNENDSIIFTSADTIGGWQGILFDSLFSDEDSSIVSFCIIEKGATNIQIRNYSNLRINNSLITKSSGCLGIYCLNSNPKIMNNIIKANYNQWDSRGGGIHCVNSSPMIINNIITENIAGYKAGCGGGIFCSNSSPLILNNTIVKNYASGYGGGIYCENNSNPKIINTIIWNNCVTSSLDSSRGMQVYIKDEESSPVFRYCNIQDGKEKFGTGFGGEFNGVYEENIEKFSEFKDTLFGDYSLLEISPCINAGNPDTVGFNLPEADIAGKPRIDMSRIDIGAYEYQGVNPIILIDISEKNDRGDFTVAPNPVSDKDQKIYFFFNTNSKKDVELIIYDALGNRVFSGEYMCYPLMHLLNTATSFVEWNRRNNSGKLVASGSYLAILNTIDHCGKRKMYRKIIGICR